MKTVKLITCNDAMKAHILQGAFDNISPRDTLLPLWIMLFLHF